MATDSYEQFANWLDGHQWYRDIDSPAVDGGDPWSHYFIPARMTVPRLDELPEFVEVAEIVPVDHADVVMGSGSLRVHEVTRILLRPRQGASSR